jgi:hypothetical protein
MTMTPSTANVEAVHLVRLTFVPSGLGACRWRTQPWFQILLIVRALLVIDVGAWLVWGRAAQPSGLLVVAIFGYHMGWENVRS